MPDPDAPIKAIEAAERVKPLLEYMKLRSICAKKNIAARTVWSRQTSSI